MANDLDLIARSNYDMATIVKMDMSIKTVGGGDYVGDVEKNSVSDHFVWTTAKASLGWCIGVRISMMAQKLFGNIEDYKDFCDAVLDGFTTHLDETRDKLDELETENLTNEE
jgi:transcription elongation factor Elf1